jgi:hypothetical protein
VGPPTPQVGNHRLDDLRMQVEAQIVAGREVTQPVVSYPDPTTPDLVDDGIHHRMGGSQPLEIAPSLVAAAGVRLRSSVRHVDRGVSIW